MADTFVTNRQLSYLKAPSSDEYYKRTINDRIRELAHKAPDKVAFVFRSPHRPRSSLTRQELLDKATLLGLHFVNLGIKPGDKVARLMPSGEYFLIVQFGLYMAGAVTVNRLSQDQKELTEMATNLGCAAIIVQNMVEPTRRDSKEKETKVKLFVRNDNSGYDLSADVVSLLQTAAPKAVSLPDVPADAKVLFMLTSGSSGVPKLVAHAHTTLLFGAFCFTKGDRREGSEVFVNDRPTEWVGGYPFTYLGTGTTTVYVTSQFARDGDDAFFVDVLVSEHATSIFLMEYRLIGIISQSEQLSKMPRLQFAYVGGQRVAAYSVARMLKFCDEVKVVYGSTECCIISNDLYSEADSFENGTIGRFSGGAEAKVVNDEGLIVPIGEVGELYLRGDGSAKEYVSLDGKSRNILDGDNWYHTGDMAIMKPDGGVITKGRKTEIIKRATFEIFPSVIEERLKENLDVQEVVVVGIPHQRLHEEVCACIIVKNGTTLTAVEIRRTAEEIFKPSLTPDGLGLMPGHFLIMEDFPRTVSFKCARSQLAAKVAATLQLNTIN